MSERDLKVQEAVEVVTKHTHLHPVFDYLCTIIAALSAAERERDEARGECDRNAAVISRVSVQRDETQGRADVYADKAVLAERERDAAVKRAEDGYRAGLEAAAKWHEEQDALFMAEAEKNPDMAQSLKSAALNHSLHARSVRALMGKEGE